MTTFLYILAWVGTGLLGLGFCIFATWWSGDDQDLESVSDPLILACGFGPVFLVMVVLIGLDILIRSYWGDFKLRGRKRDDSKHSQ